jgi:biopolymer transport protein ExbD
MSDALPEAGGAPPRRKRPKLRRRKLPKLDEIRSEINVAPLVDACMAVLIIFMVVTPELMRGKEVPLPETVHHEVEGDQMQAIVVLDRAGQLYFDATPVENVDAMIAELEQFWKRADNRRVYVKADPSLSFGKIRPIIMALHDVGAPAIDLGTHDRREPN